METLFQFIIGTLFVPLFNKVKVKWGIADTTAAWIVAILLLLLAVPVSIAGNAFAGLTFDLSQPFVFLDAIGKAFLVLLGTSQGWYMLYWKKQKSQ